ncbi:MAG: hypothetical protein DA328_05630 [Nitrososphaeraceae archaeon]|nr:hypothetical protein [Nitrososphaeraceae archaeon]
MNKNKRDRKFLYPDSFIRLLGYMMIYFHLPSIQTEGIVKEYGHITLLSIPDYGQISRRTNRPDINISDNRSSLHDDNFGIAVESMDKSIKRWESGLHTNGMQRVFI